MAVIHISEIEAVRDFASVLAHVRAGSEVVIDSESAPIALLVPAVNRDSADDPEHDTWFRAQVQEALDDRRPDIPAAEVEASFAQRRAASLFKLNATAR